MATTGSTFGSLTRGRPFETFTESTAIQLVIQRKKTTVKLFFPPVNGRCPPWDETADGADAAKFPMTSLAANTHKEQDGNDQIEHTKKRNSKSSRPFPGNDSAAAAAVAKEDKQAKWSLIGARLVMTSWRGGAWVAMTTEVKRRSTGSTGVRRPFSNGRTVGERNEIVGRRRWPYLGGTRTLLVVVSGDDIKTDGDRCGAVPRHWPSAGGRR